MLLRLFLPADRREEFEGDLIEEAETIVLPRNGRRAAQSWFWWQIAASAPLMLARRLDKEARMYPQRWIVPAALLMTWGVWGLLGLKNNPTGGFDWGNSVVYGVHPDGPADQAGLRAGDRVLTLDGIPADDLRALQRLPRTEIGGTRVLVVERTDEATGATSTARVEITYAQVPAGARTVDVVAGVIGLVFLLSGLLVFLKVQSTPSLLFAIIGFGFAGLLLPTPYIASYGLRILLSNLFFVAFLTTFACLLHLMLIFPKQKRVMEKRDVWKLIYLPVALFVLLMIVNLITEIPDALRAPGAFALGGILIGYLVLSLAALIHSFVTAAPRERAEWGLNLLLAGVVVGLLPITVMMVAGLFVRTDLLPGTDFLFLTLAVIPISFALALLKREKGSLPPVGAQAI
jgi:hypothetical protein